MRWRWIDVSSMAHYFLRDYEGCVAAGREVCRMQPNLVFGYRALLVALAELGRIDEAHQFADVIHTRFNNEIRTFLTTRNLEWPETEYTACVASFAKGGLVLRDGELARVD